MNIEKIAVWSIVIMNISFILQLWRIYQLEKRVNKQDIQINAICKMITNFIYGQVQEKEMEKNYNE